MALTQRQLKLWTEAGRIAAKLERAATKPADVKSLATQLRALVLEAQRAEPGEYHPNPPRGGDTFGRDVIAIVYVHNDDARLYAHGFGEKEVGVRQQNGDLVLTGITKRTNVRAQALADGSVLLRHKNGLPIWREFDV